MSINRITHKIRWSSNVWAPPIPNDPDLSFSHLLDETGFRSLLTGCGRFDPGAVAGCRIKHVRYRPGRSCTVLYNVDLRNRNTRWETMVYAKCLAADSYSRAVRRMKKTTHPPGALLPGPAAAKERRTILYEFPGDARLGGLEIVSDRGWLWREISALTWPVMAGRTPDEESGVDVRVLRYKPENRFVARYESKWKDVTTRARTDTPIVLRFERNPATGARETVTRRLRDALLANEHVGIPRPLFYSAKNGLVGTEWIHGTKLTRLLKTDPRRAMRMAARALSILHAHADERLPSERVAERLEKLSGNMRQLRACGGGIATRIDSVWRSLEAAVSGVDGGPRGFVHGDFHPGQLIVSGERAYVMDLDRVHYGQTTADVGNFLAQLELRGLRRGMGSAPDLMDVFLEEYRAHNGNMPGRKILNFWMCVSLLELAIKQFRRLKPDWPVSVVVILERCARLVQS